MKKYLLCFFALCIMFSRALTQSVGIGTTAPNSSAQLEIVSSTKGLLIPRMITSERTAIVSPLKGLLVYDNTTSSLWQFDGSAWIEISQSNNGWSLSGNLPTSSSFIGSANSVPVRFKVNNNLRMELTNLGALYLKNASVFNTAIGDSAGALGTFNTHIGYFAGKKTNAGAISNTALGYLAGVENITGNYNTYIGSKVFSNNGTGESNVGVGTEAGYNCSGSGNTLLGFKAGFQFDKNGAVFIGANAGQNANLNNLVAVGDSALYNNNGGQGQNTVVGSRAGLNTTTGGFNSFFGYHSGVANTTGSGNAAYGDSSLSANTVGGFNSSFGAKALLANTTGANNVAIGAQAMRNITTGSSNTAIGVNAMQGFGSGSFNTAIGLDAMYAYGGNFANNNVAVGYRSLYNAFDGSYNVAVGDSALFDNGFEDYNTAVGFKALFNNDIFGGSRLTGLGYNVQAASFVDNATVIGANAYVSSSNTMAFGNSNTEKWVFGISTTSTANRALEVGSTAANGNGAYLTNGGTWTNTSDFYKKEDFSDMNGPLLLQKIKELPVQRWKYKGTCEYHIGPYAQDFNKLFNVGNDDKSISSIDPAGISLAAIKELILIVESQSRLIEALQKRIGTLEKK